MERGSVTSTAIPHLPIGCRRFSDAASLCALQFFSNAELLFTVRHVEIHSRNCLGNRWRSTDAK